MKPPSLLLFIINPVSARGRTLRQWQQTRRELIQRQIAFQEYFTTCAGDATTATRAALQAGCERVIAVGGDGTLNEVVSGYFSAAGTVINSAAVLGLMPSGTGSDFRRTLGVTSAQEALAVLQRQNVRLIDVVRVEFPTAAECNRYLVNVASFGLGGEAVALVNAWRNTWPRFIGGRARFTAAALWALTKSRKVPVTLRCDQAETARIQSEFFVVANGRFAGGGMMFAPQASLADGLLDIVATDDITRWDILKELPRLQRGTHIQHPKVKSLRAQQVEVTSETPLAVDVDGELAGYTPVRLTVLPAAVRFFVASDLAGEC